MRNNTIVILIIFSTVLFFTFSVVGVGVSPAEIRAQNVIGSGVIGTMTLVNTVNESRNLVVTIQSPSELLSEQQHLRVICENCDDTYQRYEIIDGKCPNCNSSNLIVYERIPDEVLNYLSLEGLDCTLIKNGSMYITEKQYSMREECNIEIKIDLPSKSEYSNKHWEAHISVTAIKNLSSENMGMVAGVQMRLLLDTANISPNQLLLPANSLIVGFLGLTLSILFIFMIYIKRNTIKSLLNTFQSRNLLEHKKLGTENKSNSSYYFNKDNISSVNNNNNNKHIKSSNNVKKLFESTDKTKKDNKVLNTIEEEIDKLLSNPKK